MRCLPARETIRMNLAGEFLEAEGGGGGGGGGRGGMSPTLKSASVGNGRFD